MYLVIRGDRLYEGYSIVYTEKYDGRGQIIIERGQFFRTNLHGAVHDRPHFKIMKRGHLIS